MHALDHRAQRTHGLGLLVILFALAGAGLGTLVSPAIVTPSASPTPPCPSNATAAPSPSAPSAPTQGPTGSAPAAPTPTSSVAPTCAPTATIGPTPSPGPTRHPASTPTARPTARPSPRPTPAPTASPGPTAAPPSRLIRHGPRTGNEVALTFDMGGRVGDALAIVDWLVAHDVHASVFMTGAMADNANTDAGRQVLGIIESHPGQLTLGNHSYTHRDFRTLSVAEIADELRRTEAAIAPYCSQDLRPYFRPPSGGTNAAVLAAVGAAGYAATITWDIDTIDWRPVANDPPGPTADQIVGKVLANAQGGSIVLMHLGGYHTFDALPRIVDGLREAGFEPVTLDELL